MQNPFSASLDAGGIPEKIQDQYSDFKYGSSARILNDKKSLSQLWCEMHNSYPQISKMAFQVPFAMHIYVRVFFSSSVYENKGKK